MTAPKVLSVTLEDKSLHSHVQPKLSEDFGTYDLETYLVKFSLDRKEFEVTLFHKNKGGKEEYWLWSVFLDKPLRHIYGEEFFSKKDKERNHLRQGLAQNIVHLAKKNIHGQGFWVSVWEFFVPAKIEVEVMSEE